MSTWAVGCNEWLTIYTLIFLWISIVHSLIQLRIETNHSLYLKWQYYLIILGINISKNTINMYLSFKKPMPAYTDALYRLVLDNAPQSPVTSQGHLEIQGRSLVVQHLQAQGLGSIPRATKEAFQPNTPPKKTTHTSETDCSTVNERNVRSAAFWAQHQTWR